MKAKRQKQLEALKRLLANIESERRYWTMAGADVAKFKVGDQRRTAADAHFERHAERIARQEQEAERLRELTGTTYTSVLDMRAASIVAASPT